MNTTNRSKLGKVERLLLWGAVLGLLVGWGWLLVVGNGTRAYEFWPGYLLLGIGGMAGCAFGMGRSSSGWPVLVFLGAIGVLLIQSFWTSIEIHGIEERGLLLAIGVSLVGACGISRFVKPSWWMAGILLLVGLPMVGVELWQMHEDNTYVPKMILGYYPGRINVLRPSGFLGHYNYAGNVMFFVAALSLVGFSRKSVFGKLLGALLLVVGITGLFLVQSRASVLYMSVGFFVAIVCFLFSAGTGRGRVIRVFGGLLIALVVAAGLFLYISQTRYGGSLEALTLGGLGENSRLPVWGSAVDLFWEKPLLGHGSHGFWFEHTRYKPAALHGLKIFGYAHNEYLQALTDYGLVGLVAVLIALIGLVLGLFRRVLLSKTRVGMAMTGLVVLVGMAAHSFIDFSLHLPVVAVAMAVLVGLGLGGNTKGGNWTRLPMVIGLFFAICLTFQGALHIESTQKWMKVGRLKIQKKPREEIAKVYREIAQRYPEDYIAGFKLYDFHKKNLLFGRNVNAAEELHEAHKAAVGARKAAPRNPSALRAEAFCLGKKQKFLEAQNLHLKIREIHPTDGELKADYAIHLYEWAEMTSVQLGKYDDARQLFQEALKATLDAQKGNARQQTRAKLRFYEKKIRAQLELIKSFR